MDASDPLGIGFMSSSYGAIDPQLGFVYDDHDPTYSEYIMPSSLEDMSAHQMSKAQPSFMQPGLLDNGHVSLKGSDSCNADVIQVSSPPPASKPFKNKKERRTAQQANETVTSTGTTTRRPTRKATKRPTPDTPDEPSEMPQPPPRKSERRTRATARKRVSDATATITSNNTKTAAPRAATIKATSESLDDGSQADSPDTDGAPSGSKRDQSLRRNRIAASKCRQKKKEWQSNLETRKGELESQNSALVREYTELLGEVTAIKNTLMAHASCGDSNIDLWIEKEARRFVDRAAHERSREPPSAQDHSRNSKLPVLPFSRLARLETWKQSRRLTNGTFLAVGSMMLSSPGSSASAELISPLTPPLKKERHNYDFMSEDLFTETIW
jgi:hypothetical protein